MSEPSTPSTPDNPLSPSAEATTPPASVQPPSAGHSPEVPPGPQFMPAGDPAAQPAAPRTPGDGYDQGAPAPSEGAQPHPPVADAAPDSQVEAAPENIGRGILFSLLAIVLGAVLAGLIYQMGFIASITSFAMAFAAVWLYAKGAGAPPRAGTWPLIGVIVVGVIVSLFTMVGWRLYAELSAEYPSVAAGEIVSYVFELLFNPEVWSFVATDALIFVAFAALGTFTTLRQLRRSAAPQA
ncbi:MAG: hypothetical protein KIT69_15040 [Propionibacteriaceae bacterium]|nr:hypothetical protein [Propionibacteriaceae bacterium]